MRAVSDELEELLEAAKHYQLTTAEREAQRRSFAFGNANIENSHVTRERPHRALQPNQMRSADSAAALARRAF